MILCRKSLILFALFALLLPGGTQANLIAYDGFESGDFSGGSGWSSATWTTDANTQVVNKSMSYTSGSLSLSGGSRATQYVAVDAGSNNLPWLGRSISSTGLPIYYSFLIETATAAGQDDFIGAYPQRSGVTHDLSNDYGLVFRGSGGTQRFGVRSNNGSSQNFVNTVDVANNTVQLVVLRMEDLAGTNRLTLWVNPDSSDENSASNLSRSNAMSGGSTFAGSNAFFDTLNFRSALLEAGDTYFVDEIRIGTSFASVVIPEPSSTALLLLGGVLLRLYRGKRC